MSRGFKFSGENWKRIIQGMDRPFDEWLRAKAAEFEREYWRNPYRLLPDGTMLNTDNGNIYRAGDGMLLSDETVNVLNAEIILDDILDAEVIG